MDSFPGFYILVFLFGGFGWSFLAVQEWRKSRKPYWKGEKNLQNRNLLRKTTNFFKGEIQHIRGLPRDQAFLFCWFFFTILFFSLAFAEMISYIQPCYPAFSMLFALHLARKSKGLNIPAVRKTFFISATVIFIGLWGWSLFGNLAIHFDSLNLPSALSKQLDPLRINKRLLSLESHGYTLVQYDNFCNAFNFENRRNSVLVRESIRPPWRHPPGLRYEIPELKQRISNDEFLAVIVEPKNLEYLRGEDWKDLHTVFRGQSFVLLAPPSLSKMLE